jgi:lysophospholipase L1-like esterase
LKKEWLLAAAVSLATLAAALAIVRHYAPALLGLPIDMRLVQLDERQPAFFEGVIRRADVQSTDLTLNDPITGVRGRPFFPNLVKTGPTDVLGFRNPDVPIAADIIAIGDSQTYGVNAPISATWPQRLEQRLRSRQLAGRVYSMAIGGWAAPQYLYAGRLSGVMRPRVMVVAFYAGNDPLETFAHVYGSEHWAELRPDPALDVDDAPAVQVPVPVSGQWQVPLGDGLATTMLVELRRASNRRHVAVDAGWQVMASVATQLAEIARGYGASLVVAFIPTKESAYAPLIAERGIAAPAGYLELVSEERQRREEFLASVSRLPDVHVIDLTSPLQDALLSGTAIYPADFDGHPVAAGYDIIAGRIAEVVSGLVPRQPCGPVQFQSRDDRWHQAMVLPDGSYWLTALAVDAGPREGVSRVEERFIDGLHQLPGRPPNSADPSVCD